MVAMYFITYSKFLCLIIVISGMELREVYYLFMTWFLKEYLLHTTHQRYTKLQNENVSKEGTLVAETFASRKIRGGNELSRFGQNRIFRCFKETGSR